MRCTSGCRLVALIQVILHFQFYEVASNWGTLITRWSTAPEQHQSRCLFLQMQTSWKKNFNQKSLTLNQVCSVLLNPPLKKVHAQTNKWLSSIHWEKNLHQDWSRHHTLLCTYLRTPKTWCNSHCPKEALWVKKKEKSLEAYKIFQNIFCASNIPTKTFWDSTRQTIAGCHFLTSLHTRWNHVGTWKAVNG